jgi:hypothetical protein
MGESTEMEAVPVLLRITDCKYNESYQITIRQVNSKKVQKNNSTMQNNAEMSSLFSGKFKGGLKSSFKISDL